MKCASCAAEISSDSAFCPKCGARLDRASATANHEDSTGKMREHAAVNLRGDEPETTLWEGGYSPRAMIGSWIMAGIVSVVAVAVAAIMGRGDVVLGAFGLMLIVWAALLLRFFYFRWSISYRLTNHRFFHEYGLLSRTIERIEVIDMDDVTCQQGLVERMVNVGRIYIVSSDKTHPKITLLGIDNAREVSGLFDNARRQERRRRGLHIETV